MSWDNAMYFVRVGTIFFIVIVTRSLTRVGRVGTRSLRDGTSNDESWDNGLHEIWIYVDTHIKKYDCDLVIIH